MPNAELWPLLNVLGVLIPLVFSTGIAWFYNQPYFRAWTASYAFAFLSLVLDAVTGPFGHPVALTSLELAAYLASAWYTLETGSLMVGARRARVLVQILLGGSLLSYVAMSLAGQPFAVAVVPTILTYVGTQVALGIQLMRAKGDGQELRGLLGALVLATGLWVLTYPLTVKTPFFLWGFAVAGMLHLLVGIGMVIYLLADVALQLQRQNEELKAIDRLQQNFIGTMSHEFSTPLNAIQSGAWLLRNLKDEGLSSRQAEIVEIIAANAAKAIGLADNVLDYSMIEAGTLAYTMDAADLKAVTSAVVRANEALFDEKAIALELELADSPVHATMDAKRIGQVLTHVLVNASKFTPTGGKVKVRVLAHGEAARVEVQDDGIGIAPENREKVFSRFYQVDGSSTRRAGGTGLWLAIARAIVQDGHGGRIYAQANDGPGVTIVLELPLAAYAVVAAR